MNVDANRVIARYQAELATMTMRALAAEAAVEQLQSTADRSAGSKEHGDGEGPEESRIEHFATGVSVDEVLTELEWQKRTEAL